MDESRRQQQKQKRECPAAGRGGGAENGGTAIGHADRYTRTGGAYSVKKKDNASKLS